MLSLLLITALAVQYPPPPSKPATTDTTTPKRTATTTPRSSTQGAAVGRMAFHDRMRDLWNDHVVYDHQFIVSATAGLPDTADMLQRLLRNQDEIGEAIKPYYGDAAGSQLASLLRTHIQLAGKALVAAKGTMTTHVGMNMRDSSTLYISSRMSSDPVKASRTDTTALKTNSQNPSATARMGDTAKANARTQMQTQTATVDSTQLNQAIAALRANADSIAAFFSSANPRGFAREPLSSALQMHIDLLLKDATAQIKKDWSGSVAAFDESQRQAAQMADMLSEGIMKQFPSRFSNKATTVSSR